jgi:DNA-binding response OmpR family regulator
MSVPGFRKIGGNRGLMDKKVVLCIDDDIRDLELQKEALEHAGYHVLAFDDARAGLAVFMTHDVDLVLLDYNFPKTDGGIIAEEMRRRKPHVPIAVVSGYMDEAMKSESHVDMLFEKPIVPEQFAATVAQLLDKAGYNRRIV